MAEYTCSVCNVKFYDREKKFTNDENKCILHSEMDKNKYNGLLNELFIERIELYIDKNILNNKDNKVTFYNVKIPIFKTETRDSTYLWDKISKKFEYNNFKILFIKSVFYGEEKLSSLKNNYLIFEECDFLKKVIISDCKELIFSNTRFHTYLTYKNDLKEQSINSNLSFNDCIFNIIEFKGVTFNNELFANSKENKSFKLEELNFENCILKNRLNLLNNNYLLKINKLYFINTILENKVIIKSCEIKDLRLIETRFKNFCNFEKNKFVSLSLNETIFEKMVSFQQTKFLTNVDFYYVTFKEHSIFKNTIFTNELNLENALFEKNSSFLNISAHEREKDYKDKYKGKPINIKVANRETARIIKDSFEKQNNIIEANKYYAVEMKEREKELEIIKNPLDSIVFFFHKLSSDHSQNWMLSLFWIFLISYLVTSVKTTYGMFETILYNIFIYGVFDKMANIINPFSIMTRGESLTFSMLLFKIIIAYLIYQFIVSVRQNTRRK
ncbi:hypothetical protein [Poseidonibacter sp.]|uniref:hypothetical protein n=1 Tax=Poseidonibacter sp. TaxID=2321188 RepID=UPI003C7509B0